jgi:hypothetical protein
VSKDSPVSETPSPVILKSATVRILPHSPVVVSLQTAHKKTLGLQKPSVSNIVGRRNERVGMPACDQVGSATGGQ